MPVTFATKDNVAWITLDRPEAQNRITQVMVEELEGICDKINQDSSIYVVILTGSGSVFCAGAEGGNPVGAAAAIARVCPPVIAAINGDALGPGLELALAGDIRLAAGHARLGLPQVASGLIPVDGGTQRLARIVGRGKALELTLTASIITASEALEIGLVSKVVPGEKLMADAETLALDLASKAPVALRFIKETVNKGLDLTLDQGLRLEADLYFLLHTTADRTEGVTAFLQKRPPRFTGK